MLVDVDDGFRRFGVGISGDGAWHQEQRGGSADESASGKVRLRRHRHGSCYEEGVCRGLADRSNRKRIGTDELRADPATVAEATPAAVRLRNSLRINWFDEVGLSIGEH